MLQIHLSKALAKELKECVSPQKNADPQALQFYAQLTDIEGERTIVLMELQSRYALLFCGVSDYHIEHFQDIVQERLWREVCAIAELGQDLPEKELAVLSDTVLGLTEQQYFQEGHDPSVGSHIRSVIEELRSFNRHEDYELPLHLDQAMEFDFIVNNFVRKSRGGAEKFVPLEVFRDFWLGLLDVIWDSGGFDGENMQADNRESKAQVIHVDFKNKKLRED